MVDASDSGIVDGADLDVELLVGTVVGSIVATWWAMWARAVDATVAWGQELLLSPIDAISSLLEQLLLIPANSVTAANQAAAEFMMMLSGIGPLAWPLGMLVAIGTIWATQTLAERAEVI